jgi:hypothetical protein
MSLRTDFLEWDDANDLDGNIAHIARHKVTVNEVQEVCDGSPLILVVNSTRIALVGKTAAGRLLAVILDLLDQPHHYRPVTAYTAGSRFRRLYRAYEQGDESL